LNFSISEKLRVESSGGFVKWGWVNGRLAVSRAIVRRRRGRRRRKRRRRRRRKYCFSKACTYFCFTSFFFRFLQGDLDKTGKKETGVSAVPEINRVALDEEDEFLVVASDGLWEVLDSQQVVTMARESLKMDNDVQKTSQELMKEALKRSEDNITVIVVGFG